MIAASITTHSGMVPLSRASSRGVMRVWASAVCQVRSVGLPTMGSRETRAAANVERITARSLEI